MRVLLDECVPRKLKRELPGHHVRTVPEMGWAGIKNSELLRLASDDYPILDIRALWSLQCEVQQHQYDYELWREYVQHCRILAKEAGVSVRTLDKALWQYSKSKQLGSDTEG